MNSLTSLLLESYVEKKINSWLNGNYDADTKNEINKLITANNKDELTNSFYKDLEFGTGGLRGVMGVGSNKINKYTIGAATQGLSNYLLKTYPNEAISVAIAYDSRNNSEYFASVTANVFAANGIKVYFFTELRPTPELSFAIRHLRCKSGVVITASHNPKEYNGYKAYWSDGAQMIAPHDENVILEVNAISSVDDIKFEGGQENIVKINNEIDEEYLTKTLSLSISTDAINRQKDLKIVFSPIHGTGITLVPELLKRFGFTNLTIVDEQSKPDGNFPTVVYPNPEESEALTLALNKAIEIDADLVIATDPDADRVGIAIKNTKNEFQLLNGNQTGALLVYYLIKSWKDTNKLTGKEFIVKTIVTSNLLDTIAERNKVKCYNTLTGFKFIANIIAELEGKETFIGGGEESYGYLVGDFVRDKDAVSACAFIAEMVAWAKDQGSTPFELLLQIYKEYGFYKEKLISITKKGKTGAEEIKMMMERFRLNPPTQLASSPIVTLLDYENQISKNLLTGEVSKLPYQKSDVLQFITLDGTKVSARPSGTEPKIKFYFSVNTPLESIDKFDFTETELDKKIAQVVNDLGIY